MRTTTIVIVILAIMALAMVACSPQETIKADNVVDNQDATAPGDDVVTDTLDENLVSDDDFVEIGEMI